MAVKLAFINSKGGCGKTTSLFHIAGVLSMEGARVLVVDFDKQRNTTETMLMNTTLPQRTVFDVMCGTAEPSEAVEQALFQGRGNAKAVYCGVDCMASDIRLENEDEVSKMDGAAFGERLDAYVAGGGYDWVLVDMPPSSKALNSLCFNNVVGSLIVPLSSDFFSVRGYGDLIVTLNRARAENPQLLNIGVYLSRYMGHCALDRHIRGQLMDNYRDLFIDVQIPLASDVRESVFFGRPISYYKTKSKSRMAYEELVEAIKVRVGAAERQG